MERVDKELHSSCHEGGKCCNYPCGPVYRHDDIIQTQDEGDNSPETPALAHWGMLVGIGSGVLISSEMVQAYQEAHPIQPDEDDKDQKPPKGPHGGKLVGRLVLGHGL